MEKQLPTICMQEEPLIQEYLTALLQSGKRKEVKETKELLDYLDTMEQKVTELVKEVSGLKETIQALQNPEAKSRLSTIANKVEIAITHTKSLLERTKDSYRASMKETLMEWKSKGRLAVIKAVDIFHFKQAIQYIGSSIAFTKGTVAVFNDRVTEITTQSRQIKHNVKNIGRILTGKAVTDYKSDKAKVNALQRAGAGLFHCIEGLYDKTQSVYNTLDSMEKTSVKKDLKQIENSKASGAAFFEKALTKAKDR